jgi:serine/threonine protein kinase
VALAIGTRIGPYEVTAPLGVGGMGEVYRATDTELKRQVALKVLPALVADDPERLARFRREAEVLAQLNHPNIAQIYGLERLRPHRAEDVPLRGEGSLSARAGGGASAPVQNMLYERAVLVMELVEGPTLADRIAQGPIPLDEALPIAKQIAEALEAAHEQGIIHRDLKPANIKVKGDGTVKVLDFGLAKAMEPAGTSSPSVSQSPTITTPAMTQMGVILGTAAYMSPEQAKGKPADKRSDVWAFGCVLYEVLTGARPFAGDDISDTLASVLKDEPDWNALPASTPASIRRLVKRCLEKDRRKRLADAADARLEIDEALMSPTNGGSHVVAPRSSRRQVWPTAAAACVSGLIVGAGMWTLRAPDAPRPVTVTRFSVALPDGQAFSGRAQRVIAISPDGTEIVYRPIHVCIGAR